MFEKIMNFSFFNKIFRKMIEQIHDFIICWEIPIKFITTIISIITFIILIYNQSDKIFNKYSINSSETTINPQILTLETKQELFTGVLLNFTIINESDTLSTITEPPKIYISVYYNYSKFFCRKDIEVKKYVDSQKPKKYPITIEKRGNREYFSYKLRTEFFSWLNKDIDNDDIRKIKIYLTFYNDVNKKTKMTEPITLNYEIYSSKKLHNLHTDFGVEHYKKMNNKPPK